MNIVFLIRKLADFVPTSCLRLLYFSHFFSKLSYGLHVWFPLLKEQDKDKVRCLHKRIVHIINRKGPRVHCKPLYKSMELLTIEDLIVLQNVKLLYRVKEHKAAVPIINLFPIQKHSYSTRRDSFVINKHTLSKYNASFLVRAIIDWDKLQESTRKIENIKLFSRHVKKDFFQRY